jgi:hypothetical protein
MTQKEMFQTVTSSPQVTPVSLGQSLGYKKEQQIRATSGRKSLELLHPKDPLGAFSKMFMVTLAWDSTRCCTTWKAKATPRGRLLFQLVASVLPIKETDSGLWPTPRVGGEEGMETLAKRKGVRKAMQHNLTASVQYHQDPMTWSTPTATMYKGSGSNSTVRSRLDYDVEKPNGVRVVGSLNPNWVEWLMGYPRGWTDLTDGTQSQKTSQE